MPPSPSKSSDHNIQPKNKHFHKFPEIGAKCKIRQALSQAPLRKGLARVFDVHTTGVHSRNVQAVRNIDFSYFINRSDKKLINVRPLELKIQPIFCWFS